MRFRIAFGKEHHDDKIDGAAVEGIVFDSVAAQAESQSGTAHRSALRVRNGDTGDNAGSLQRFPLHERVQRILPIYGRLRRDDHFEHLFKYFVFFRAFQICVDIRGSE